MMTGECVTKRSYAQIVPLHKGTTAQAYHDEADQFIQGSVLYFSLIVFTRFKIYFPSLKHTSVWKHLKYEQVKSKENKDTVQSIVHDTSLEEGLENVTENESRRTKQIKEYGLESEFHTKSGEKQYGFHHETKLQFDEDGDLIVDRNTCRNSEFEEEKNPYRTDKSEVDRNPCRNEYSEVNINPYRSDDFEEDRNDDSRGSPKRKKIKQDIPKTACTLTVGRKDVVDALIHNFDRIKDSEKTTEDGCGVNRCSSCNILSEGVTDVCKCCDKCHVTDQQFVCKCALPLAKHEKPCDIYVRKKHPNKGKQKMVRKSKVIIGIGDITVQSSINTVDDRSDYSHDHKGKLETREEAVPVENGNQGTNALDRNLDTKFDIYYLSIKHSLATDLEDVGEQVWHGALLLSDYIISYHGDFENKTIVDLGAGVGLSSIVAAMYAKTVFCTDTGEKVLSLAEDNVYTATTCPTLPRPLCTVLVKQLDWFTGLEVEECKHALTEDDITSIYNCDILLAADVIYDFDMTDAFFNVVKQIMIHPPTKTLYIGLEKRLVFTVEDLEVTSPCYNYFRLHLDDLCSNEGDDLEVSFDVEQIDTIFQQYFQYKRIRQLEVWKITATFQKS